MLTFNQLRVKVHSFFTHWYSPEEFIVESSHDFSQFLGCCGVKPKAGATDIIAVVRGAHRLLVKPFIAAAILRATVRRGGRKEGERRGGRCTAHIVFMCVYVSVCMCKGVCM